MKAKHGVSWSTNCLSAKPQSRPCTWFLELSCEVAFARICQGYLVAVTMSTTVWLSKDGSSWSRASRDLQWSKDGRASRDLQQPFEAQGLPLSDRPPGLRCQVSDVSAVESSEILVVARHRETCQLTLWRLSVQERFPNRMRIDSCCEDESAVWQCLVPQIHIYPGADDFT